MRENRVRVADREFSFRPRFPVAAVAALPVRERKYAAKTFAKTTSVEGPVPSITLFVRSGAFFSRD